MVMADLFNAVPILTPDRRENWAIKAKEIAQDHDRFSLLWEIQARASTGTGMLALALLIFLFGWSNQLSGIVVTPVMFIWAFAAATVYCKLRCSGAPDLMNFRNGSTKRNIFVRLFLIGLKALVFIGVSQIVLSWIVSKIIGNSDSKGLINKARRRTGLTAAVFAFGVVPTHSAFNEAGWKEKDVERITKAGRLVNVPVQTAREILVLNSPGVLMGLATQMHTFIRF